MLFLRANRGSELCTYLEPLWARPQGSSPGPFSAWSLGFHSYSHLSTPSSWWATYSKASVSKCQRRVLGKPIEPAPFLPTSTWGCSLISLSLASSSVRGGWLCPLQRAVAMVTCITLIIAVLPPAPVGTGSGPFPLCKNIHIPQICLSFCIPLLFLLSLELGTLPCPSLQFCVGKGYEFRTVTAGLLT